MEQIEKQPWETVNYTDNPELPELAEVEVVNDFLPSQKDLVFKQPKDVKVTITLDPESVIFLKQEAQRLHTPYQRMIRNLLVEYVNRQKQRGYPGSQ